MFWNWLWRFSLKIIIIGAGKVGFHIASRLAHENKNVVVIDQNPEAIRRVSDKLDVQTVIGSGSSPVLLKEAGVREAEILLAVTNSDETNLVACLAANILSPTTKKLARIRNADFDEYHATFCEHAPHIDTVINPEIEVVKTIDRLMSFPGVADIAEFVGGRVKFVGIYLDSESRLANVRLSEFSEKIEGQSPLIAAVVRDEELIIPRGDDRLMPDDLVYFISEENSLQDTLTFFGKHLRPVQNALIVGGGRVGYRLARLLEEKSIYTKIIEKDVEKCTALAESLNKAVVLHGDGSDQELLNEENIQDMDVFIALTNDDETNILASLLAKTMGVRNTVTRISKFGYSPLMSAIGIEQVVSSRLSAVNTILQHIRKGKVLSAISIKGEQAEVIEAVALETSDLVGKPLHAVSFPKGALIVGIIHNDEITIPSGGSIIEPEDRIIIFARREAIPKVEKILTVKLEYF